MKKILAVLTVVTSFMFMANTTEARPKKVPVHGTVSGTADIDVPDAADLDAAVAKAQTVAKKVAASRAALDRKIGETKRELASALTHAKKALANKTIDGEVRIDQAVTEGESKLTTAAKGSLIGLVGLVGLLGLMGLFRRNSSQEETTTPSVPSTGTTNTTATVTIEIPISIRTGRVTARIVSR